MGLSTSINRASLSRRNEIATLLAALVLSTVCLVVILDQSPPKGVINVGIGLAIAYALALVILGVGVRPAAELRCALLLLLGTGTGWLILWKFLGIVLSADRLAMPHVFPVRQLASDIPLCALGVGVLFGRVAYIKAEGFLSSVMFGFLYGTLSGFALLGITFLMTAVIVGDNAYAAVDAATNFIPASAITAVLWSAGFKWHHKRQSRLKKL